MPQPLPRFWLPEVSAAQAEAFANVADAQVDSYRCPGWKLPMAAAALRLVLPLLLLPTFVSPAFCRPN